MGLQRGKVEKMGKMNRFDTPPHASAACFCYQFGVNLVKSSAKCTKKMPRQPNVEAHKKNSAHPSKGGAEGDYITASLTYSAISISGNLLSFDFTAATNSLASSMLNFPRFIA